MTMRIGVFLPAWVGDACMATPTLKALRQGFPSASLVGIGRPVIRQVLESPADSPAHIDEWICFHKKWTGSSASVSSRLGLVRRLRASHLDALLLLTNSLWTAGVARAAGVPRRVGYDRDRRGWLLTDRLQPPREGRRYTPISAVDYYLELAHWLGCQPEDKRMQLTVDENSHAQCDLLWQQLGLASDRQTVVINNNAANQAARMWPDQHVQELAVKLVEQLGVQVLLHCGPGETEKANRIAAALQHPSVVSMGQCSDLPIGLSKAVLARADVVISTDSGARHMAVALDRPVVTLFGPTSEQWTRTYNQPEQVLAEDLDCRACYRDTCPYGHGRCLSDLTPDRVLQATRAALGADPARMLPILRHHAA